LGEVRFIFIAAIFTAGLLTSAQATTVTSTGASIFVYGSRVITLRTSVGNLSPKARAEILARNLEKHLHAGEVKVERDGKDQLLYLDGTLVLTVTRLEAKANSTKASDLASQWAKNLRRAFLTPPIKIDVESLRLPLGINKSIAVAGSQFANLQVEATDPKVIRVEKIPSGIALKAIGYGRTELVLTAGGTVKTLPAAVLPYGANVPTNLVAIVSGIPASQDTVEGAIEAAVRNQLGADPTAKLEYKFPSVTQILPGESRTFTARVRATGPNVIPAEGPVTVTVKNVALGRMAEGELWYCNEPENLQRPGLLFVAPLRPESAARMLYHHINLMPNPLVVTVDAINDSDIAAKVMVIPGDSKPDRNPVLAGVQAADQFMKGWAMSSGEVVTIPPHTRMPLAMRKISQGQTMSGLCYLRLLESGPDQVTIRTEARPPFPLDSRWLAAIQSSTPWRYVGSQRLNRLDHDAVIPSIHIYPNPFKEEEGTYQVGGKYAFFRIGEKAISRADKLDKLSGNFGVTYTIKAQIENPTPTATEVELVFEASAGYSGALFFVNGQFVKTPLLQPKTEAQIAKFTLEPGASRTLSIITVPLSGSSYPATLTIRPTSAGAYAKGFGKQ
jgi:hypothetical protein